MSSFKCNFVCKVRFIIKLLLYEKRGVDKWSASQWELELVGRTPEFLVAAITTLLYEGKAMLSGRQVLLCHSKTRDPFSSPSHGLLRELGEVGKAQRHSFLSQG